MATYFDSTDSDHTDLLHSSVRSHAELARISARVEQEVIDYYTQIAGYQTYEVRLQGYAADADNVTNADFKRALRETIADVISHRLRNYDSLEGLTSESLGDYSYTRSGDSRLDPKWPGGWNWRLGNYDLRQAGAY